MADTTENLAFGRLPLALTLAVVALGFVASLTGFVSDDLYREAPAWLVQCYGQDLSNLIAQMPALLVAAIFAARGCRKAVPVWFGLMIATVYSYVLYAFAVHQNRLYLVYCAVLGLSIYALLSFLYRHRNARFADWLGRDVPRRAPAIFLLVVAALFLARWLELDIAALVTGTAPAETVETGLPVNAVHSLDYAFLLPAMVLSAILLLRRHDLGYFLAPAMLAFSSAMSVNIVVLMLYTAFTGGEAVWPVIIVIALIALAGAGLLVRMLRGS